ncbi:MAG: DUF3376 domain-containing protein [Nitrospirae bacterium]|nr:DUF3376 domain-containing protein [Nitrospirota bacterium]
MAETKIINLALAFYGGVSLAVYEAGVADELLRFLQFCREQQKEHNTNIPDIKLKVIAGSSAGGLAGVMLAAAYINSTDPTEHINEMRNIWFDVADFSTLQYKPSENILSLLNNNILEDKLDEYLQIDQENAENRKDDVKDIILKITGTNMQGLFDAIPVEDDFVKIDNYAKKTIPTTRYTEAFTFSHVDISDAVTIGDIRKKIAHASRVTSSFPVAFPPQNALSPTLSSGTIEDENDKSIHFWYCDGGVLDNKPLGYAIDEIETSPANGEWLFIFIDPQPEEDQKDKKEEADKWNKDDIDPAETLDTVLSIKSSETIYYDLGRIQQINNQVMQIRGVVSSIWPVLCNSSESTLAAIGNLREDVAASRMYRFLIDYIKCVTTIRRYSGKQPPSEPLNSLDSVQQEISNLIEPLNLIETIDSFISEIPADETELKGILSELKIDVSTEDVSKIIEEYNQLNDSNAADNPFNDYTETVKKIKKAQLCFRRITFWVEDDCNSATKVISDETWSAYIEAIDTLSELVKKLSREYNDINKKLLELFGKIHNSPDELCTKFVSYLLLSEAIHAASRVETRQLIDIVRIFHDNKKDERLAGALLAHFSAFLDKGWRKNDYLWGKLDARKTLKDKLRFDVSKSGDIIYPCFNVEFWKEYESRCKEYEQSIKEQYQLDEEENKLSNDYLQLEALPSSNIVTPVNGVLKTFGKLINKYKERPFFNVMDRLKVKSLLIPLRFILWLVLQATAQPKGNQSEGKVAARFRDFKYGFKHYMGFFAIGIVTGIFLTYFGPNFIPKVLDFIKGNFIDKSSEYIINPSSEWITRLLMPLLKLIIPSLINDQPKIELIQDFITFLSKPFLWIILIASTGKIIHYVTTLIKLIDRSLDKVFKFLKMAPTMIRRMVKKLKLWYRHKPQ